MQAITTIGPDIAKSVFQIHGTDAEGNVLIRRQLERRYVLAFLRKLPGSTLKNHRDEAITHTGRIVSIALILTEQ